MVFDPESFTDPNKGYDDVVKAPKVCRSCGGRRQAVLVKDNRKRAGIQAELKVVQSVLDLKGVLGSGKGYLKVVVEGRKPPHNHLRKEGCKRKRKTAYAVTQRTPLHVPKATPPTSTSTVRKVIDLAVGPNQEIGTGYGFRGWKYVLVMVSFDETEELLRPKSLWRHTFYPYNGNTN
ncbi:hypothetical protein MMC31_003524 [Peltigera leucophlebia]|nr:hypothetical protein [Peltigera leucophlebia]